MLETVQSKGAYAIIVSDAAEIVLFGVYTIFFTFALLILTTFKKPLPVDVGTVVAISVLYVVCMAHCSAVTTDRHTTFTSGWPIPSGREMSGLLRVTDILYKTCAFLSQLIMIHRCWAVWDYRHTVVFIPLLMAIAGFVCAILGPARLSVADFVSPFVAPRIQALDLVFSVLSLLVFALTTYLIILRLRRVSAPVRNVQSMESLVWSLVGACIEAGALLVLAQLAVVILLAIGHPAIIIAESLASQVYGIAPTMMIIRLGLSLLPRGQRFNSSSPQFSTFLGTFYGPDTDTDEMEDRDIELARPYASAESGCCSGKPA
ncbi:hypothetical protein L226DRAFT_236713 [Lentinus tigrinus ALCF2SS1-7]|uniref:uncharacterized protein n=1 Tax=Lentinus tigrinus ALCF2SS1-7 TaxID=1328758 RepID=UPI0011662ABD|nr:hypothetical protein L226DRAFT_236713 [Lentinus tigrinus ALCF2SS1-7]